jgi:hypothetical protein
VRCCAAAVAGAPAAAIRLSSYCRFFVFSAVDRSGRGGRYFACLAKRRRGCGGGRPLCGDLLEFLLSFFVFPTVDRSGRGGPHFLCLAKESGQRKARLRRRPAGALRCSPCGRAAELALFARANAAQTAAASRKTQRAAARRPQDCAARRLRRRALRGGAGSAGGVLGVLHRRSLRGGLSAVRRVRDGDTSPPSSSSSSSSSSFPFPCSFTPRRCRGLRRRRAAQPWGRRAQRARELTRRSLSERRSRQRPQRVLRRAPRASSTAQSAPADRLRRRAFLCPLSLARQRKWGPPRPERSTVGKTKN